MQFGSFIRTPALLVSQSARSARQNLMEEHQRNEHADVEHACLNH
jgi:hypothetical protein